MTYVCILKKDGSHVKGGNHAGISLAFSQGYLTIMAEQAGACLHDGRNSYERIVVRMGDIQTIQIDHKTLAGPVVPELTFESVDPNQREAS